MGVQSTPPPLLQSGPRHTGQLPFELQPPPGANPSAPKSDALYLISGHQARGGSAVEGGPRRSEAGRPCAGRLETGSGLLCAMVHGALPRIGLCCSFPESGAWAATHDPPPFPTLLPTSGRRPVGRLMAMSSPSTIGLRGWARAAACPAAGRGTQFTVLLSAVTRDNRSIHR